MYALLDANNFYASCEAALRPSLIGRPVCVLSNNDGCVIARSEASKAMGVKMGQPYFEVRHLEAEGLVFLSPNFTLYGSMSDRVMSLAAALGPSMERYSIDEAFVSLHGVRGDQTKRARAIRARILQWTGIACGVGIAQTKTLSKFANHVAKQADRKPGSYPREHAQVCNLGVLSRADVEELLAATEVAEVWGVGRRIGEQLRADGVMTALDLARLDPAIVRRRWSVVLERTVRELQGESCIELEDAPPAKREIAVTRSFGHPVTDVEPLVEAVSTFASRAAEKLRKQSSVAGLVHVFAHTSPFRPSPRWARSLSVPLRRPTADTAEITEAAVMGLRLMFEPGYMLAKAGVMLCDLSSELHQQCELDLEVEAPVRDRSKLMKAMDQLNTRYGRGTLQVAAMGQQNQLQAWQMRQERRTPHYTTDWRQIPIARA